MKALNFSLFLLFSLTALSDEVELMYYERAPLFYTDISGSPSGLMIDKLKTSLNGSSHKVSFAIFPAKRQFTEIVANKRATCGIGWFKNTEREKLGKFSHPIFTDEPLVLITHKSIPLKNSETLVDFFKRQELTYLKKNGFSYGDEIDALENAMEPKVHVVSTSTSSMFEMVGKRKWYYTLLDGNEVNFIVKNNPKLLDSIHFTRIKENSKGNVRYLLCSAKTPDKFLNDLKTGVVK